MLAPIITSVDEIDTRVTYLKGGVWRKNEENESGGDGNKDDPSAVKDERREPMQRRKTQRHQDDHDLSPIANDQLLILHGRKFVYILY